MVEPSLDLITIGRVSVDLYGQQTGGRLEDMASFAKYVGGCPATASLPRRFAPPKSFRVPGRKLDVAHLAEALPSDHETAS